MTTIKGTGTFGKVLLTRLRSSSSSSYHHQHHFALKVLEKLTIVRLRQVEHLNSERSTLAIVDHPFIVNLLVNHHSLLYSTLLLNSTINDIEYAHFKMNVIFIY
jgi:hypothetical protein